MTEYGTKKYLVKSRIMHDGTTYEIGSTIQISEAVAAQMPHAVEELPAEKTLQEK